MTAGIFFYIYTIMDKRTGTLMRYIIIVAAVFSFLSCSKDNTNNDTNSISKTSNVTNKVVIRKKIDRLTPKTYVEVTIDLYRQQEKWNKEFQNYMKKQRDVFYQSYGLSETKYMKFMNANRDAVDNYLNRYPHLRQKINQLRSMYTQ